MRKGILKISIIVLLVNIIFSGSSCSNQKNSNKITVSWFDSDGSLIEKTYIDSSENFEKLDLPSDTEEWHYTDWKIVYSSDLIICVAQRTEKIHYTWKDYDGTLIKEDFGLKDSEINNPKLPASTERWVYTGWDQEFIENTIVFTAQRTPNKEYFQGNIFQIVLKDENGDPLSTGSGFVINKEGWFITNNHVMDGGYSAVAYFDIEDQESNQSYVQLSVIGGVYNNKENDIFIGKLSNYYKIEEHYNNIVFTEKYEIGAITYTIGYPNSSLYMEINQGTLLEEYKDIYGKINNNYYLLSDSYIAPGSSGGILINDDFEVIGITTIGLYADSEKSIYLAGGSVPTRFFVENIKNLNEENLKLLTELY